MPKAPFCLIFKQKGSAFCYEMILSVFKFDFYFYQKTLHVHWPDPALGETSVLKVLEESCFYIVVLVLDRKIFQSLKSDGMENTFLPLHFFLNSFLC